MSKPRKHFSELSRPQIVKMWNGCVDAAIEYAKKINMSGLSECGSHNIYTALKEAVFGEWEKAKEIRNRK
ncbi:hypothetical protein LCGC14_1494600 [marine sediment metagenome]|uniref:Uncharacterized protein n=1 Tax=marine sediment metagenome TaxID=412755 RepID=A0A0F9M7C4_9ZZZZ